MPTCDICGKRILDSEFCERCRSFSCPNCFIEHIRRCHKRVLYGNFPIPGLFDAHEIWDKGLSHTHLRAEIPYTMARAFARSIKEELEKSMPVKLADFND